VFGFFTKRQRERLREGEWPEGWEGILVKNVPLYSRLNETDRRELQGHVRVFLDEKTFEGCGGLTITDEIRVTCAAQACMMLLHRETDYFRRLITILVYPSAYIAHGRTHIGGGVVLEGEEGRLGEAWVDGVVVLSWDDVLSGGFDPRDGHNVVLHEFAHQLDHEDGAADGAPVLAHRSRYAGWARVLGSEFEQLRGSSKSGRKSVLDKYGATNPAEFFAVATECFFEKPLPMRRKHPELYDEMKEYYRLDPAAASEATASRGA
jgi:Mlc titration factor MtfA (ptsG expression regulator)